VAAVDDGVAYRFARVSIAMKPIPLGIAGRYETVPGAAHTAAAVGNTGVEVVGTPFLIGYFEIASHTAILPYCEAGEATVGTRIEVDHLAPALPDRPVVAEARIIAVEGRRVVFAVELRQGERLIMKGRHGRAIVDLARLLARAARPDRG
jgi:fluoroacetyl-CoA thioesterase